MQTPLEKYFALRVKNLFNHLHDFELTADDTSMHDLRVEMKKMKSVLRFLRNIYPAQSLKKPAHLLGNIFQHAGEIREYQLLQQWLKKHELTAIQKVYFPKEQLQNLINDFRSKALQYKNDLNEVIEQISKYVSSTREILADQYFTDMNAQSEKLCRKNLPNTEWHELRKIIKQRIYSYNWLQQRAENEDPHFAYLNKLQELIGQWHDHQIIQDAISKKQVYLSQDLEVQKDFTLAWDKLTNSIKQREKQIEEMLAKGLA